MKTKNQTNILNTKLEEFMKKLNLLLVLTMISAAIMAQDAAPASKWVYKGQTGLNFTQTSFTNWSSGGENSYSLVWNGNFALDYKGEKAAWNNNLDLGYGLTKQGEQDIRKMVDKINFLTKYSLNGFNDKWRYTVLLNFKSQFTDGFEYKASDLNVLTSTFLAPGYLTGSFGIEYLGSDKLKIFISPASQKTTLISESYYDKRAENRAYNLINGEFSGEGERFEPSESDIANAEAELSTTTNYGLKWRENSKLEIGALAQVIYDHPEIIKNVGFKTRLDLFSAYNNIDKVDVDWEVWLTFKVNEFLSMNINTQLIYDDDIKFLEEGTTNNYVTKIQFREMFGIGVVYTFK